MPQATKLSPAHILLVDDSPADQLTVERALEEGDIDCQLSTANNGRNALAFLLHEAPYRDAAQRPTPDLILLDINMPIMDGFETLARIRKHQQLNTIPVVMLTTSDAERDVLTAYRNGANAYITKPANNDDFIHALKAIDGFWFHLAKLPSQLQS